VGIPPSSKCFRKTPCTLGGTVPYRVEPPFVSPAQEVLAQRHDGKDRSGSFLIAQITGRQFWMEIGRFYDVFRIQQDVGRQILLHRIICYEAPDGSVRIGQPFLEQVRVYCTVLKHFRGNKVITFKFRPKKHYRKLIGHRQDMTRIRVDRVEVLDDSVTDTEEWKGLSSDPFYRLLRLVHYPTGMTPTHRRVREKALSRRLLSNVKHFTSDPLKAFDTIDAVKVADAINRAI